MTFDSGFMEAVFWFLMQPGVIKLVVYVVTATALAVGFLLVFRKWGDAF